MKTCDTCGPDYIWPEHDDHCSNCMEPTVERESPEEERDRYRAALQRILDHGQTHDEPCYAIHNGDCADVFQEIARAALAETAASSRTEHGA